MKYLISSDHIILGVHKIDVTFELIKEKQLIINN